MYTINRSDKGSFNYAPIQFAFGPIQNLYAVLVWKAPVHTGLLGLASVTCGVIHTHPAHLQSNQVVWEKGREKREHFCSIRLIQPFKVSQ